MNACTGSRRTWADPPRAVVLVAAFVSVVQFPIYIAVLGQVWSKGRLIEGFGGVGPIHAAASGVARI